MANSSPELLGSFVLSGVWSDTDSYRTTKQTSEIHSLKLAMSTILDDQTKMPKCALTPVTRSRTFCPKTKPEFSAIGIVDLVVNKFDFWMPFFTSENNGSVLLWESAALPFVDVLSLDCTSSPVLLFKNGLNDELVETTVEESSVLSTLGRIVVDDDDDDASLDELFWNADGRSKPDFIGFGRDELRLVCSFSSFWLFSSRTILTFVTTSFYTFKQIFRAFRRMITHWSTEWLVIRRKKLRLPFVWDILLKFSAKLLANSKLFIWG